MGLVVNGVFDRFPKVQVVIGHMGELLPANIWRFDHVTFFLFLADELVGMARSFWESK